MLFLRASCPRMALNLPGFIVAVQVAQGYGAAVHGVVHGCGLLPVGLDSMALL